MTFLTDGAVFEISRTSLSNVTLETIPTDSRGSYVLDGDADCVSAILNYYRTEQLHIPQVSMFAVVNLTGVLELQFHYFVNFMQFF